MSADSPFAVIIESEHDLNFGSISRALAAWRQVPLQDATFQAKKCWGIVDENLTEENARRLVQFLSDAKIRSIITPQNKLPLLPAKIELHHVFIVEAGLTGKTNEGREHILAWENMRVISAAAFKSTTVKKIREKRGPSGAEKAFKIGILLTTGIPLPIGGKDKIVEKTVSQTELNFSLTIITSDPSAHYLIPADNIDYSFLKERKTFTVMGNFKTVLGDVLSKATRAKRSRGTQILQSSQPVSSMGYESYPDVERECRWLFLLKDFR